MFAKKFKVRITYFGQKYYVIEYAYYRIFPFWKHIYQWIEFRNSDLSTWNPILGNVFEMEEKAKTFKTYSDIQSHYTRENENRALTLKRYEEYQKKYVPYNNKTII